MEENLVELDSKKINQRYVYRFFKRLGDIILSLLALFPVVLILTIVALFIKLDDGGPVFFTQTRVGKNGKPFKIFKVRSMRTDAEKILPNLRKYNQVSGPMFKMKDDPRITRVGRFIRKYSIDELPQLINVLKGDMSLVGPRPGLPIEVKEYTDYAKQRLYVLPGCTGLWQATDRSNTDFDGMINLDLHYIQNASIWLDLKIIFLTFKVMIVPNGAY